MSAKNLNFSIDIKNTDVGVKKLLQEIRPTWQWDNIEQKVLSGGFSCVMMRCYDKSNSDDSVTVRIQDVFSNLSDKQKEFELQVLSILSQLGLFSDLLATFENGYCYQFILGKPITTTQEPGKHSLTDSILKAVAKSLVQVHTIKIPGADYRHSKFFESFLTFLNHRYNPTIPGLPTKEKLEEECEYLKSFLDSLNTPIGFCHGDFHLGNMIWNQQTETITFIDWDLAHIGYQYADLSHFVSFVSTLWTKYMANPEKNENHDEVAKDVVNKFCKFYYEEWIKHHEKSFVQSELDSLRSVVKIFHLCDTFMILMCGLCFPVDETGETNDLPKFQENTRDAFLALKKRYCGSDKFGYPDDYQKTLK